MPQKLFVIGFKIASGNTVFVIERKYSIEALLLPVSGELLNRDSLVHDYNLQLAMLRTLSGRSICS